MFSPRCRSEILNLHSANLLLPTYTKNSNVVFNTMRPVNLNCLIWSISNSNLIRIYIHKKQYSLIRLDPNSKHLKNSIFLDLCPSPHLIEVNAVRHNFCRHLTQHDRAYCTWKNWWMEGRRTTMKPDNRSEFKIQGIQRPQADQWKFIHIQLRKLVLCVLSWVLQIPANIRISTSLRDVIPYYRRRGWRKCQHLSIVSRLSWWGL